MKDRIQLKQMVRTGFVLLIAVMTSLAIFSCKKLDFTKVETPATTNWLHYDNGTNYTGINANSGGNFDIAIRFNTSQLANYQGFVISKIKFFPVEGYPAAYSIILWKGAEPPAMITVQPVLSVISGAWNEVSLSDVFYVDASQDLWVDIWVQDYPAGTFPAGCDAGPAVAGKGDLYSIDDGFTWNSLYNSDGLNYNWNLQVSLTNLTGQKAVLVNSNESIPVENKKALKSAHAGQVNDEMISQKKNAAHENN